MLECISPTDLKEGKEVIILLSYTSSTVPTRTLEDRILAAGNCPFDLDNILIKHVVVAHLHQFKKVGPHLLPL